MIEIVTAGNTPSNNARPRIPAMLPLVTISYKRFLSPFFCYTHELSQTMIYSSRNPAGIPHDRSPYIIHNLPSFRNIKLNSSRVSTFSATRLWSNIDSVTFKSKYLNYIWWSLPTVERIYSKNRNFCSLLIVLNIYIYLVWIIWISPKYTSFQKIIKSYDNNDKDKNKGYWESVIEGWPTIN